MSRLFVFGCSFTSYHWPTWADFISFNYDEYWNYAKGGAGNRFIFEKLIEADLKHNFNPTDKIYIMWTTYMRHDLYKDNNWHTHGNVFTAPIYNRHYHENYVDFKGSVIHTLNYIHGAIKFLKGCGVTPVLTSMNDLMRSEGGRHNNTIFDEYEGLDHYKTIFKDNFWIRPPLCDFLGHLKKWSGGEAILLESSLDLGRSYAIDQHPPPDIHLKWAKECLKQEQIGIKADQLLHRWRDTFPGRRINAGPTDEWILNNTNRNYYNK